MPTEWLWFDVIALVILAAFIVVDRFFVRYERGKELNLYCYWGHIHRGHGRLDLWIFLSARLPD